MIVTFTSQHSPDIIMFGDIAQQLLKMMGHSGTVPGAIRPEDLPGMLENLNNALAKLPGSKDQRSPAAVDSENKVPLSLRAMPLIELLESAIENEDHVMWK